MKMMKMQLMMMVHAIYGCERCSGETDGTGIIIKSMIQVLQTMMAHVLL